MIMAAITLIPGVGQHTAEVLAQHGFASVADIAGASVDQLRALPGFGAVRATGIIDAANRLLNEQIMKRVKDLASGKLDEAQLEADDAAEQEVPSSEKIPGESDAVENIEPVATEEEIMEVIEDASPETDEVESPPDEEKEQPANTVSDEE